MKLCLWGTCLVVVIVSVVFGRIWENVDRGKKSITKSNKIPPSVRYKVCLLSPSDGPCRGNINMYYFDPSSMSCSQFSWGGCQGNGNRFDSEAECMNYCVETKDNGRTLPSFCQLSFDYGYCFGNVKVYYYDNIWQVCKTAVFSGCGGNENNFVSRAACESACTFRLGLSDKARGSGKISSSTKRVVVVNPPNTTPFRGKSQLNQNHTTGTFVRKVVNASGYFLIPHKG